MSSEKHGFVYLWRDSKHNRYYVGCHWGREDDNYICSSSWMKKAHKNRPQDFRRRILKTNLSKIEMFDEELRIFGMIKPEEIKVRYYNLNISNNNVWHKYEDKLKSIGQKISGANKGRKFGPCSPEKAAKISARKLEKGNGNGRDRKITLFKGLESCKFNYKELEIRVAEGWSEVRSPEYIANKKENQKRLCSEKLTGIKRLGPRSEKQMLQAKEQQARIAKDPTVQSKKSLKIANKKWCYNPDTLKNMRLEVIPEGWRSGKYGSSPVGGSTTWNDGVRNHRVKQGEQPDPTWIKGMVPRG